MERESWRFPLWNYDYQRDCSSQVCSIYQTLSAPFFPGCLWLLLAKQSVTTPSVLPPRVTPVPRLSLLLYSALLPFLGVIFVQQGSDFSGLPIQHKAHSAMRSQEELCPSVLCKCHPWFFLSLHVVADLHVLSVSFSPDAFALLYCSSSSSQSAFIMHLMYRYLF